jgi:hypothetical protein
MQPREADDDDQAGRSRVPQPQRSPHGARPEGHAILLEVVLSANTTPQSLS